MNKKDIELIGYYTDSPELHEIPLYWNYNEEVGHFEYYIKKEEQEEYEPISEESIVPLIFMPFGSIGFGYNKKEKYYYWSSVVYDTVCISIHADTQLHLIDIIQIMTKQYIEHLEEKIKDYSE